MSLFAVEGLTLSFFDRSSLLLEVLSQLQEILCIYCFFFFFFCGGILFAILEDFWSLGALFRSSLIRKCATLFPVLLYTVDSVSTKLSKMECRMEIQS